MKRIEEFSDDDIIEELMKRYDDIVIGARKILDLKGKETQRFWWYKGDPEACSGIITAVSSKMINKNWKEMDDGL